VTQPKLAAIRLVALLDQPQRGELQVPWPPPHDQVQHDRQGNQRRSGQQ